ncbi:MAG TPA: type II modification methylase [Anaerolineae bacterium]|nr:type II modification methylase [Anaerolineae bacterium]
MVSNLHRQLRLPLEGMESVITTAQVSAPSGYRGLYRFHKYWGKKPFEPVSFIIKNLTDEHEIVLDPFVGSGVVAVEAACLGRRFIGIDLNPIAIEISRLLVSPPEARIVEKGFAEIERRVRRQIEESYKRDNGDDVATHFLWENQALRQVWVVRRGKGGGRRVFEPMEHDVRQFEKYEGYQSRYIRPPRFFTNSRINVSPDLTLNDLFTGRALRNIDLLLDAINSLPSNLQPIFSLCLTAACGQMSNMVFAITGRGKMTGHSSTRIEVGSWVIGYWRPELHFEINVWNCFARRVRRLVKASRESALPMACSLSDDSSDVLSDQATGALCCDDALEALRRFPANSIDLILTDPPHSDRVPYLELSGMWNAILGYTVDFQKEIVVSNARERHKGGTEYNQAMRKFLALAGQVLKEGHFMIILFNARDSLSWEYLNAFRQETALEYKGHFPLSYSAGSVVQDSRNGSLKNDLALVFQKQGADTSGMDRVGKLRCIEGWSDTLPGGQEE